MSKCEHCEFLDRTFGKILKRKDSTNREYWLFTEIFSYLHGGDECKKRPEIICICGSSKFVAKMAIFRWELEKSGKVITLGMHLLPYSYKTKTESHLAEVEGVADIMDELHLRKIDISDKVFIFNYGGYIGKSTQNEIEYAEKIGKPITYLE